MIGDAAHGRVAECEVAGWEQPTLPRGGDRAADTVELEVVEDHHGVGGQVRMPAGGVVQDGVEVVQSVDEQQPAWALPGGGGLRRRWPGGQEQAPGVGGNGAGLVASPMWARGNSTGAAGSAFSSRW